MNAVLPARGWLTGSALRRYRGSVGYIIRHTSPAFAALRRLIEAGNAAMTHDGISLRFPPANLNGQPRPTRADCATAVSFRTGDPR